MNDLGKWVGAGFREPADDHDMPADDFDPAERPDDEAPEFDTLHDCRENEVEESTYPTRSGRITVTGVCSVCGSITTPPFTDSIL